jgi:hypothetical protein
MGDNIIKIGRFQFLQISNGNLWMSICEGEFEGEGMEVSGASLPKLIEALELFWKENF